MAAAIGLRQTAGKPRGHRSRHLPTARSTAARYSRSWRAGGGVGGRGKLATASTALGGYGGVLDSVASALVASGLLTASVEYAPVLDAHTGMTADDTIAEAEKEGWWVRGGRERGGGLWGAGSRGSVEASPTRDARRFFGVAQGPRMRLKLSPSGRLGAPCSAPRRRRLPPLDVAPVLVKGSLPARAVRTSGGLRTSGARGHRWPPVVDAVEAGRQHRRH